MILKKMALMALATLLTFSAFAKDTVQISQNELIQLMKNPTTSNVVVLDVRTKKEFDQGHIEGAVNMSHDLISANIDKLSQFKDKLVVVHCRSGRRAVSAENILSENGFNQLRHLSGDMKGWQAADLPTVKSH